MRRQSVVARFTTREVSNGFDAQSASGVLAPTPVVHAFSLEPPKSIPSRAPQRLDAYVGAVNVQCQELLLRAYEVGRSRRRLLARGAAVCWGVVAWDGLAALVGDKLAVVVLRAPLLLLLPFALLLLPTAILSLGTLLLTTWHPAPSIAGLILGRRLLLELGYVEEGVEGSPLGVADVTREVVDLARHTPELGDALGEQLLLHCLSSEQAGS